MAFDVDKWVSDLKTKGHLSEAEAATFVTMAKKPGVAKELEEGQLRQSDYSKRMEDLAKQKKESDKVVEETLAWRTEAEKKIATVAAELESEKISKKAYEAKLKSIATEYGVDIEDVKTAADTKGGELPKNVVTRESLAEFGTDTLMVQSALTDLAEEHRALFNKPLSTQALVKEAIEKKIPLRQLWEEKYKVQEVKDQLATKEREDYEARIRREEREKVMSEMALPGTRKEGFLSPALQLKNAGSSAQSPASGGTTVNEGLAHMDRAKRALEFFQRSQGGGARS